MISDVWILIQNVGNYDIRGLDFYLFQKVGNIILEAGNYDFGGLEL